MPTQYKTIHSHAHYKLHNTKICTQNNYTMQITCRHVTIYVHNKYFNWLALNMMQRFNTRARVLIKRTRSDSFDQYHFQFLARAPSLRSLNIARACLVYWIR